MKEEFIEHIGFTEICDILSRTNRILILCLPNIDIEVAHTIVAFKIKKNLTDIKVITDNSENNFRNGFGEISAIEKLKTNGIELYELSGNMVSFVISDNTGYYLFPQSKIFSGDEDLTSNAVKINPIDIINIKNYFFPPKTAVEKEKIQNEILDKFEEVKETITESIKGITIEEKKTFIVEKLNDANLEKVRKSLKINPPEHPDLKRKINTYITKIQFVELSFEGEHFNTKDVHIPSKILPFKDKELQKKLIAKMKLFGNITEEKVYKDSFSKLTEEIAKIRKEFLVPLISRKGKSIIKVDVKIEFQDRIKTIIEKLPDIGSKLKAVMQQEILNSKKRIKNELTSFLIKYPPDNIKDYTGQKTLYKKSVTDEIEKLVNTVKFPEPHNILNKINIKYHYFDLTIDDLSDDELLKEFKNKKIMSENDINSIVEIKKTFAIKK